MQGHLIETNGTEIHARTDGDAEGRPLVLLHALGTDLRLWGALLDRLPSGLRIVRLDMRGHGLSSCPPGPYPMGALVSDAEGALDALGVREAVVVGLSIGGLIAQGLAVKRPDLFRALVLSNTGAKIGTPDQWNDRIATARQGGLEALADATLERWFPQPFRDAPGGRLARNLLLSQRVEGWAGCAAAISNTDFLAPTSGLRLPTLGIAGDRDGSTPPDLVRETADLIPGARVEVIRGAGHLPCVDAPDAYARILTDFLTTL